VVRYGRSGSSKLVTIKSRMRLPISLPLQLRAHLLLLPSYNDRSQIGIFGCFYPPHSRLKPSLGCSPGSGPWVRELVSNTKVTAPPGRGENRAILRLLVVSQCWRVTDGQSDRQTETPHIVKSRYSIAECDKQRQK